MSIVYELTYYTYTLEGAELFRDLSDFFALKVSALEALTEIYKKVLIDPSAKNIDFNIELSNPTLQWEKDNKWYAYTIEKREVH